MSELRFHSADPTRPTRTAEVSPRAGAIFAAVVCVAGTVAAVGLMGSPSLVGGLVHSADRLALRETAMRGQEAFASVRRRHLKAAQRLAADELFLARVATLAEVPLPPDFPGDQPKEEANDPELAILTVGRRVRDFESFRRRLAAATQPATLGLDASLVPSRSPIEPSGAVPVALFGPRLSPLTKKQEFHAGLTLAAPADTLVIAPAGGRVVFRGVVPGRSGAHWRQLGTVLVIAHDEGTRTVYGHLGKVIVAPKQSVRRGEPIGRVGASGWVSSPQLYYEVRKRRGGRLVPVDPRLYILDADWISAAEVRGPTTAPPDLDVPSPFD